MLSHFLLSGLFSFPGLFSLLGICSFSKIFYALTARIRSFLLFLLSFFVFSFEATALSAPHSFSGAYLAARTASKDGAYDKAVYYFRQALSDPVQGSIVEPNLMLNFLMAGQFSNAALLANKLRDDKDIGRIAHLILISDYFRKRQYHEAKAHIVPQNSDIMEQLADNLLSAWASYGGGDPIGAIQQLKKLSGPAWYQLFRDYHLALIYDLQGQKKEAETAFHKAFSNHEGGAVAPDGYEQIIIAYASFLSRYYDRNYLVSFLQQAEKKLSSSAALQGLWQHAITGKPILRPISTPIEGAAEALYDVGTTINNAGADTYGQIYLQMAFALFPSHDASLFQLAQFATKVEDPLQAVYFYRKIMGTSPYFFIADQRIALNLAEAGETKTAIKHLEQMIEYHPKNIQLSVILANIYMNEFAFKDAIRVLNHAILQLQVDQKAPLLKESWPLFFQRAIAYERLNQWELAEPDFRQALILSPDHPQILNYLGYSLIDRNLKLNEAFTIIQKAASLRPEDGYIIDSLGWAYYKLKKYEEAVKKLEKAILLSPGDAAISNHLGDAYWQMGRKLEATFQWQHALNNDTIEPETRTIIEKKLKYGLIEKNGPSTIVPEG